MYIHNIMKHLYMSVNLYKCNKIFFTEMLNLYISVTFMRLYFCPRPILLLQELQKFSRFVVGSFFHMGSQNPLVFVELLVWKTSQDVYELSEGYGALERER